MKEIEALVERTVGTIARIADRAARFSSALAALVAAVCVGGLALGVTATSGGLRSVWIVLGVVFGGIAIGAAGLARWRVGSIKRHIPDLVNEMRALISNGTTATRDVIETFSVGEEEPNSESVIEMSRGVLRFKTGLGHGLQTSARLTSAVTALTSFPLLVLASIGITVVFGFLSLIFLIALAF
jgi:hypothetical protein